MVRLKFLEGQSRVLHEKQMLKDFFLPRPTPDSIVFLSPGRLSDVSAKPWRSVYMQQ